MARNATRICSRILSCSSRFRLSPAAQAAKRNSPIPSKTCRNAGSGVRHMVRYVSRKGSQPVRSPWGVSALSGNLRYFRSLAGGQSVSAVENLALFPLIDRFLPRVSGREIPISKFVLQRLSSDALRPVRPAKALPNPKDRQTLWLLWLEKLRGGVLFVFGAPCQLRLLTGQEHGRTIPLADNRSHQPVTL